MKGEWNRNGMAMHIKLLQLAILIGILVPFSQCDLPAKRPISGAHVPWRSVKGNIMKSPSFPAAAASGRRTFVLQIRSDHKVPIVIKRNHPLQSSPSASHQQISARPLRPIKMVVSPHLLSKSHPFFMKFPRKPHFPVNPSSSNSNKGSTGIGTATSVSKTPGDYNYEKPFSPAPPEINKSPITPHNQFGPIHTIPAPNLSGSTDDSNVHFQDLPLFTPQLNTFYNVHNYQVTEDPSNDHTVIDPISGQHKYFAPDPDPSLPAAKIPPALDPHSIPSEGKPLPTDIQNNYLAHSGTAAGIALVPLTTVNHLGADISNYATGAVIQPHLHPFVIQQTSASHNVPLSVYNPTYLVTQSKNLYEQHQQQLFKPNPNYQQSLNSDYPSVDLTQNVASNGQILQAAKDPVNQIHPQFSVNSLDTSQSQDKPTFAALIASNPSDNERGTGYNIDENLIEHHLNHHGQLQAVANAFNIGNTGVEGGFVVSNYFDEAHNPQNYQEYVELTQRQQENERILQESQLDLQRKLEAKRRKQISGNLRAASPSAAAFAEHQKLVQSALGTANPLRIFIPDEEAQGQGTYTLKKRSDDYTTVETTDEDISADQENEESFSVTTSSEISSSERKDDD